MEEALRVLVPLINPNEPEALLAAIHVHNGQAVKAGDPLFTLETTKSTAEVPAEGDGYIVGLQRQPGETVRAGDLFCYLAAAPDWQPAPAAPSAAEPEAGAAAAAPPADLRITRPALALAQAHQLDLNTLPKDRLVTEALVQQLLAERSPSPTAPPLPEAFDAQAIIIYGGGGHGKALIDLVRLLRSYRIVGIVDDGLPRGQEILGVPVLGGAEVLPGLVQQGVRLAVNAVGGIGSSTVRQQVFQNLRNAGLVCPALVHPAAFVEPSAQLAPGVQIFAHAYVGSDARLGFGVIVNTGAIISHDCQVQDYANISPGAILAGEVTIGKAALVGMGATINLRVKVGAEARIGNGATVKKDVPEKGLVRAGGIWPEG